MIEYNDVEFGMYDLDPWLAMKMERFGGPEPERGQLELLKEKIRLYPPIPAKDMLPSWYTEDHVLRHCLGIKWVTSRGYLMRAPTDITIRNFMISEMAEGVMTQGFPFEDGELPKVFKIDLPWMIRSKDKKPIDFLVTTPAYHLKSDVDIRIQQGILAGDKIPKGSPHGEEINPFFCSKTIESETSLVFKEGDPIVQLIPVYK